MAKHRFFKVGIHIEHTILYNFCSLRFFFGQINSFVVTACRNRAFIVSPSTDISDSNVYTNETGKRQMI
jgi:hypothetical protein